MIVGTGFWNNLEWVVLITNVKEDELNSSSKFSYNYCCSHVEIKAETEIGDLPFSVKMKCSAWVSYSKKKPQTSEIQLPLLDQSNFCPHSYLSTICICTYTYIYTPVYI